MAIGQWFNEGASAQSAGTDRGACPYRDEDARNEWLSGFDEATKFEAVNAADEADRANLAMTGTNSEVR
ncbi:ribosome modulation factor [Aureimonas leprariae]|uniref:Ribosome modulation factor n=1 Tax=Plantimonas leprariae TaxID=2615207 RepID=A0A7V7PSE1_9HYPH|nr:Rmf/CrpP family protein [Aureimonas leprariae]KAB0682069.1 hypothetical protein F6X38_04525 [Aureimonas leprariae]